ncbi:hypothetical protein H5410_019691 [Solanum commersonii]|uniref:Uncharacterized protein n=1 Tax=Solanum commersonii TaxID=4109 RepID=A0A9J5Z707_SOLCO|nr:hypothetical protein H5410_019691 [Solanum commersonii]
MVRTFGVKRRYCKSLDFTNKGCGGVRFWIRAPLGTESPLLGSALPLNVGLSSANPNLVRL